MVDIIKSVKIDARHVLDTWKVFMESDSLLQECEKQTTEKWRSVKVNHVKKLFLLNLYNLLVSQSIYINATIFEESFNLPKKSLINFAQLYNFKICHLDESETILSLINVCRLDFNLSFKDVKQIKDIFLSNYLPSSISPPQQIAAIILYFVTNRLKSARKKVDRDACLNLSKIYNVSHHTIIKHYYILKKSVK